MWTRSFPLHPHQKNKQAEPQSSNAPNPSPWVQPAVPDPNPKCQLPTPLSQTQIPRLASPSVLPARPVSAPVVVQRVSNTPAGLPMSSTKCTKADKPLLLSTDLKLPVTHNRSSRLQSQAGTPTPHTESQVQVKYPQRGISRA
jgi:hypothetical protein